MSLTNEDIQKISQLLAPLEEQLTTLSGKVTTLHDEMNSSFDNLYSRDEKREQEYFLVRRQLAQLQQRVENLENKGA